jgi:hypothetical protein
MTACLLLSACGNSFVECPRGTARLDGRKLSGGTDIGQGFRKIEVADGVAGYRDAGKYQCGFVCAPSSEPAYRKDGLVCVIHP